MRHVAVTLLLCVPAAALAQISPGELARAHESLEGMTNCTKCHELGSGPSAEKCLACHTEIASRMESREGYHHRVVGIAKRPCFECHSDHAGRSFDLIHWQGGQNRFDHRQAGWPLGGAHAKRACRDCHTDAHVAGSFKSAHENVDPSRTFLGLDGACLTCHKDPHAGQFERACESCHDDRSWKPAAGFDHARTTFPLFGRHAQVSCDKCHATVQRRGAAVVQFADIEFKNCAPCHKDPHAGRLGAECASCHGQDAWKPVTRFDHARTDFPLTGKHAAVDCMKCHKQTVAAADKPLADYAGLPHDNCAPCHTDPHAARLGNDCASCHATAGWNAVVAAGAFDHSRTRFPLLGLHKKVACEKCHRTDAKTTDLAFDACDKCHADVHDGQFVAREGDTAHHRGPACEGCHNVDGFVPALFTAEDHAHTTFALSGAHLAQPCVACHRVEQAASGKDTRRFVFADTRCTACHEDPHAGQFAAAKPVKSCEDCHAQVAWKELDFSHDKDTRYPLVGQHRAAACGGCHVATGDVVRFRGTPTSCEACHSDQQLQLGEKS